MHTAASSTEPVPGLIDATARAARAAHTLARLRSAEPIDVPPWPTLDLDALAPADQRFASRMRDPLQLTLRDAGFDDARDIAAFGHGARRDTRWVRDWILRHAIEQRSLWVALHRDRVVGWLSLLGLADRLDCDHSAEIDIRVDAGCRQRGVGTRLLGHAIAHASATGIDHLVAYVPQDDATAHALVQRYAFRVWGSLPDVLRHKARVRDIVIYGRVASSTPRC